MKYKVGDKVRVRKWDDMAIEYGTDDFGNINTPRVVFVKSMKEYCNTIVTIRRVKNLGATSWYDIEEDNRCYMWTGYMFENTGINDLILEFYETPMYYSPRLINNATSEIELKNNKETKSMNTETKKEKKKQPTERERLEQKLEECRKYSIVKSVKVIVPNKVVKVSIDSCCGIQEYKLVCNPQDEFSIERAIILAFVKFYNSDLTPEGIEHEADQFKFSKSNLQDLKAAMKVYKAQQALIKYEEKEKAERAKVLENRKRKKARKAAKLKAQMEQEAKESARIQAEAFKDVIKDIIEKYDIPEKTETVNENRISVKA